MKNTTALSMIVCLSGCLLSPGAWSGEQPVRLDTPTGSLHGTLNLPQAGKPPLVLLISGSGPTDRDGNQPSMRNDSLKQLALALEAEGIASLRYDKRGIAASAAAGPNEADMRFSTGVDDALAWIVKMRQQGGWSRIVVAGHSEGALIGLLATRAGNADAVVSISGQGRPASQILREQLAGKLPAELAVQNEAILKALEKGEQVDNVPAPLASLYRKSVQPYLISWFTYTPANAAAALGTLPLLIIQGSTDLQVTAADIDALKRGQPAAKVVLVQGANHVLKPAVGDIQAQLPTYQNPALPINPQFAREVAAFIRDLPKLNPVADPASTPSSLPPRSSRAGSGAL